MKKFEQQGTTHLWEWVESDSGELTVTAGCFTGSLRRLVERIGNDKVEDRVALIRNALKALGRREEVSAVSAGYGYGNGRGNEYGNGTGHGYGNGQGDGIGEGYGQGDGDGGGNGYGNGYGHGNVTCEDEYGQGSGHANGHGYGFGQGSGFGYGYGFGDDSGHGYGFGFDVSRKIVVNPRKPAGLECE
jgi:hypothetical protein